jgi:hypothetical protein
MTELGARVGLWSYAELRLIPLDLPEPGGPHMSMDHRHGRLPRAGVLLRAAQSARQEWLDLISPAELRKPVPCHKNPCLGFRL